MKEEVLHRWLIRMSQGDEEAFNRVYEATRNDAYRMIYFLTPHKQETGDILSEVYMELYRNAAKYNPEQPFRPWFSGLIIRQVRSWKRKAWRSFRLLEKMKLLTGGSRQEAAELYPEAAGERLDVLPYVESLSHKLKEVIVLRYYHDYSLEQIAQLLHVPLSTAKSRHRLAIKKLRGHIIPGGGETREEATYVH